MSTSPPALLRICHFESAFTATKPYFCYSNEVCCKEGCCSSYNYKHFQTWYFWLGILAIFALYRYVCWYCKKMERRNRGALTTIMPSPRLDENAHGQELYNQLIVAYAHRNQGEVAVPKTDDPPPVYSVAVNLPKPESSTDEDIPTYEQAISK